MASITWSQALAWRQRQQLLDPIGTEPVEDVVRRLGAVQAQQGSAAELSIRLRRARSHSGEVAEARADGRLIMTFAFRGATHLMTPEDGGIYLALRMANRQWELRDWQTYYKLAPSDWPALREVVRAALADGPLTVKELVAAIAASPKFGHLGPILAVNPKGVMKVLGWHGEMSFGPFRGKQATFQRLDGNPRWAGIPDLDEAGMRAVEAYFRTYGPATSGRLQYWLGNGLSAGKKRIEGWIADFGDRLAEIDVDGESALVLRDDLDDLAGAQRSTTVRLLPAYDQWVFGPGTADDHIVPAAHRTLVTRGANLVLVGGVVSGAWSLDGDEVAIDWFRESGSPPGDRLAEEIGRLATILDRPLRMTIRSS